jgi:hypothetical protein
MRFPSIESIIEGALAEARTRQRRLPENIQAALVALGRKYEGADSDVERSRCLLSALIFSGAGLPYWLYHGMCERLAASIRQWPHDVRYVLVCDGRRRKLSWPDAYKDASMRLAGTSAAGGWRTMKRSYQLIARIGKNRSRPSPPKGL